MYCSICLENSKWLFLLGADQWLSEATFLTGKGPGEAIDKITESPEEAGIVKVGHILSVTQLCSHCCGQCCIFKVMQTLQHYIHDNSSF